MKIEQALDDLRKAADTTLVDTCIHNKEFIMCNLIANTMLLQLPYNTRVVVGDEIHYSDRILVVDRVTSTLIVLVAKVHYKQ